MFNRFVLYNFFLLQERLTAGHGSITLSGGSPATYGHGGHGGSSRSQGGGGGIHSSMHQQLPQPDFQPPYFPPPFHHAPPPSPPPPQQTAAGLEYLADPYGGLGGLHHYNQLGLRPREPDPSHGHVVSTILTRLLIIHAI